VTGAGVVFCPLDPKGYSLPPLFYDEADCLKPFGASVPCLMSKEDLKPVAKSFIFGSTFTFPPWDVFPCSKFYTSLMLCLRGDASGTFTKAFTSTTETNFCGGFAFGGLGGESSEES
jgi:hypothetical protein